MLTIQISDQRLENRIAEKAKQIGKTAQEFVESLLAEELIEDEETVFSFRKLDPLKHGHIIDYKLSEEELALANDSSVKPFSHVTDSAKYVHDLRHKPRG